MYNVLLGMADSDDLLTTTATSLRIMETVAELGSATAREVGDETDHAKSTVYKHLTTLRDNNLLIKEGEQYRLSLHHLTLGNRAVETRKFYRLVEQKMKELKSRTDAEIDFTAEENGRLIMVFETAGSSSDSAFGPGSEFYLHNTAAGKAILAEYADERVDEILDTRGLPQTTPHTITSREVLHSELTKIRETGFAFNDEECVEGYRTVSSVIMKPDNTVLGALSIGGPVYRIEQSRLENEFASLVLTVTENITQSIEDIAVTQR